MTARPFVLTIAVAVGTTDTACIHGADNFFELQALAMKKVVRSVNACSITIDIITTIIVITSSITTVIILSTSINTVSRDGCRKVMKKNIIKVVNQKVFSFRLLLILMRTANKKIIFETLAIKAALVEAPIHQQG